jgi:leucyl aminopeptidase (aminopeptidase T)
LAAQLLGKHTSPTQAAVRAERLLRIQEALNTLDPLDREVLSLRHFEQLNRAETAQVLGIAEAAAAKRYVRALKRLKEVRVTNPNGTDLTMRIEKRPVYVSDGVLTPEKQKKGGPACQMWLPAGEVYVSPVPDTAEGKVVFDRYFHEGKLIEGLTLTVQGGKVTSIEAKAGGERLLAQYKVAGAGKDRLSMLDIGTNPNVRIPANSKVLTYLPAGMITIGTGNDTWAGGDNTADFGLAGFLPKSTLKVDGRVIVEKGALKL